MRKGSRFRLGRIAAAVLFMLFVIFLCRKLFVIYELNRQIEGAEAARQELLDEQKALAGRKEELQDPAVIERKARDDLGMVKPGEVPYVR